MSVWDNLDSVLPGVAMARTAMQEVCEHPDHSIQVMASGDLRCRECLTVQKGRGPRVGSWDRTASRREAASESDPHVVLRVINKNRSLREVQAYLYRGWRAYQVEDGTIFISGHDDGKGFGMSALRDRLLSGLISTEIVSHTGSDWQEAVAPRV